MVVCLINAEANIEHLILYYDYDKDSGDKVEDLSKVKNHGTAKKQNGSKTVNLAVAWSSTAKPV